MRARESEAANAIVSPPHLQRDVGLGPVLDVPELHVRVPVHEVDTDQPLAALALEARETLAQRGACLLHTGGAVLTPGQLAGRRRHWRWIEGRLAKLSAGGGEEEDIITALLLFILNTIYHSFRLLFLLF